MTGVNCLYVITYDDFFQKLVHVRTFLSASSGRVGASRDQFYFFLFPFC